MNNLAAIRTALESAGVDVIAENVGRPGVRLRKARSGPASIPLEDLSAENDE